MSPNNKDRKLVMAKSKFCEMKVDQLVLGLKKTCSEKGIKVEKQIEQPNEPITE